MTLVNADVDLSGFEEVLLNDKEFRYIPKQEKPVPRGLQRALFILLSSAILNFKQEDYSLRNLLFLHNRFPCIYAGF